MPRFITALWNKLMEPIAARTRSKLGSLLRKTTPLQYPTGWLNRKRRDKNKAVGKTRKTRKSLTTRRSRKVNKYPSELSGRRTEKYRRNTMHKRRRMKISPTMTSNFKTKPIMDPKPVSRALNYFDKAKKNVAKRLEKRRVEIVRYSKGGQGRRIQAKMVTGGGSKRQRHSQRQTTGVRRRGRGRPKNPPSKNQTKSRDAQRSRRTSRARRQKTSRSRKPQRTVYYKRVRRYSSGSDERSRNQIATRSISQERQSFVQEPPRTPKSYLKQRRDEDKDNPLNVKNICRSLVRRIKEAPPKRREDGRRTGVGFKRAKRRASGTLKKQVRSQSKRLLSLKQQYKSSRRPTRKFTKGQRPRESV